MVQAGLDAAPRFSYERYLIRLDDMCKLYYGSSPFSGQLLEVMREQLRTCDSDVHPTFEPDRGKV